MTIPTVTTLNAHGKRYHPKGDGRDDDFVQMLPDPVHEWDYWAVMPVVESRLEAARAARAEQERAENYNRAVESQHIIRVANDGLPPEIEGRMKRKPTDSAKIDALEPAMEDLYSRGMSVRQIGKALDIHWTTVQKRLVKKGVA